MTLPRSWVIEDLRAVVQLHGMHRRDHTSSAVAVGLLAAAVASVTFWLYRSSIPFGERDGLEGVVFLPILFCTSILATLVAGWRRTSVSWPLVCATVACLAIAVALIAWGTTRGGPPVLESAVLIVLLVYPVGLVVHSSGSSWVWAFDS